VSCSSRARQCAGSQGTSVRVELQADCRAGISANHVVRTGYIEDVSRLDINDGIDAAAAIGGDRIQPQRAQGQVTPETSTHGSAPRQHCSSLAIKVGP
jgi:uncharacterized protein